MKRENKNLIENEHWDKTRLRVKITIKLNKIHKVRQLFLQAL